MKRRSRVTRHEGAAKPKVLLVDDHRHVLTTVSSMLSDHFDVAGLITSGADALETARRVRPDVIVLDVDMPGFDGFQTFRALEQGGLSATPVVFLSMHDADEIIVEAFRCGGRGYVLKSRAWRDLPTALDQALRGDRFVPSLTSLFRLAERGGHAMHLYDGVAPFVDGAAHFLDLALRRGDATCVIANQEVREALRERLRARGWDVGGASGHKRYLAVDAADALNNLMRGDMPDPNVLEKSIAEMDEYRLAAGEGPTPRLTVLGNMVVPLSLSGNTRGAIAVERLWGSLTHGRPFLTLCSYPTACFHEAPEAWSHTCREHWAISHAADV